MSARMKVLAAALAAVGVGLPVSTVSAHSHSPGDQGGRSRIQHVLLLSVDGLHQVDLQWYIANHPDSALAQLADGGAQYTNARTPIPSDSFPGMVGQVTGGDPRVTGVFYDDTFNHAVDPSVDQSPPGQTDCSQLTPGAEVTYFEQLALDFNTNLTIDSGAGLPGLPGHPFTNDGIMQLTTNPLSLIDPNELPRNPANCQPIYPNQYLKVNTIFNVARDHGLLTAWSDKHAAYEILQGPEGNGITDEFTPEINANAFHPDGSPWLVNGSQVDYTGDNAATMQYDDYKVQAVLNEINGFDHSGSNRVGVPAIFGMNFQTVSTAEKLPTSSSVPGDPGYPAPVAGGYTFGPNGLTPGPLLQRALNYINSRVGMMMSAIQANGLAASTAIILSAKHGQSPLDPRQLVRVPDGPIMDAVNAAWASQHPDRPQPLILGGTDDDATMWWLNDQSQVAADFVANYLMSHSADGNALDCTSSSCDTTAYHAVTVQHSGLTQVFTGAAVAHYFGLPNGDPRVPNVWGIVQVGVVYTGGHKKIAEHGGANPGDRDVPLVVYGPGVVQPRTHDNLVETTQIAPTILHLLGLPPGQLDAVREEGTHLLPGLG